MPFAASEQPNGSSSLHSDSMAAGPQVITPIRAKPITHRYHTGTSSGNGGEYVQLSLNIPIYDRLQKYTTLSKRKNAYQRASLEYDKSLRDVESEVRRAIQDRDGAESALLQAERRADVYDEAYKLNARKFEQGLISSIEYNTASSNYLKAKAEKLNAELQYQLKRRVVEYYNGVSYLEQ